MPLCDVFLALGEDNLSQLLRHVSLGKLRTYQLFDRMKTRLHLGKLNQEILRKIAPKVWSRIGNHEEDLAVELSQAVLVSHLDMIVAVLDHLEVPHQEGFFDKDAKVAEHLTGDWQQRSFDAFREKYPHAVLTFYLNHLSHEVTPGTPVFAPAAAKES
ncbi:MAG: hypothetical protein U0Q16_13000 [Bryobacteraceae bacterium]